MSLWGTGSARVVHTAAGGHAVCHGYGDDTEREHGSEEEPGTESSTASGGQQGGEGAEGAVATAGRLRDRTRHPGPNCRAGVAAHREETEHRRAPKGKRVVARLNVPGQSRLTASPHSAHPARLSPGARASAAVR